MPVDHVVATLAFLGQEFERLFGANTDFDREMLRNVFDSVDRNKAPTKLPRTSMNQPWLLNVVDIVLDKRYDIILQL